MHKKLQGEDMEEETLKNETLLIKSIIREPLKDHIKLLYNHFVRYSTAIRKLEISKNDTVIDASCGYGYGSYILSWHAKEVLGLDNNSGYLYNAKEIFGGEKIRFCKYEELGELMNTNKITKVNKIVCIETYEHLTPSESNTFVQKLLNYLQTGGNMFLTVPLGKNEPSSYNKYHLFEPSIDYMYNLFSGYFKKIIFEISTFRNSYGHDTKYCMMTLQYLEENKKEI